MKKKKVCLSLLLVLITIFLLVYAKHSYKKVEFASNASNILINAQSSNVISMNVALFSNELIREIECVGIEGTNVSTDDYKVTIIDNNSDMMDIYTYKGVHIKYIMIEIFPINKVECCQFEKVILSVDGQEREIRFDVPVQCEFVEGNVLSEELQVLFAPNEFHSKVLNDKEFRAIYEFEACEDMIVTGITFKDFLEAANVICSIDGIEIEGTEFPIQVRKGEYISFGISFESSTAEEKNYVLTNMSVNYTTMNGEEKSNKFVVLFDPIYPIINNDFSHINKMIDDM